MSVDLRQPITYSFFRIPEELWAAYFGLAFPEKWMCLQAGLRPLPRIDGHVYAGCAIVDSTPQKKRWERAGLLWLLEEGAEVVSGGARAEDCYVRMPELRRPDILRARVHRTAGGELLQELASPRDRERQRGVHGVDVVRAAREAVEKQRAVTRSVPMTLVEPGDVVEEVEVRPVVWARKVITA